MPNPKHFKYSKGLDIGHRKITPEFIIKHGTAFIKKLTPNDQKRFARYDSMTQRMEKYGTLSPSEKTMNKALESKK